MNKRHLAAIIAGVILGIIFVAAGLGKLFSEAESFRTIFNPFPGYLASVFTQVLVTWLPPLEVVIGLLLIGGIVTKLASILAAVLIAGFITNNGWLLSQGLGYKPCDCLGVVEKIIQFELSTTGALYLDIGMLVLALIILYGYQGRFLNVSPWFIRRR